MELSGIVGFVLEEPQAYLRKLTGDEGEGGMHTCTVDAKALQPGASQKTPVWATRASAGSQEVGSGGQGPPTCRWLCHSMAVLCPFAPTAAAQHAALHSGPAAATQSRPTCAWRASLLLEATASAREPMARPKTSTPQAISRQSTSHSATFTGTMSPAGRRHGQKVRGSYGSQVTGATALRAGQRSPSACRNRLPSGGAPAPP